MVDVWVYRLQLAKRVTGLFGNARVQWVDVLLLRFGISNRLAIRRNEQCPYRFAI